MVLAIRGATAAVLVLAGWTLASACSGPVDAPATGDGKPRDEDQIDGIPVFWRVAVDVQGEGNVHTFLDGGIDCTGGLGGLHGACGPAVLISNQRQPATLQETPASGWTFAKWQAHIRQPDGTSVARTVPDPASPLYLDGFGPSDTGQTEAVTAVFVEELDAGISAQAETGPVPDARPGLPTKP